MELVLPSATRVQYLFEKRGPEEKKSLISSVFSFMLSETSLMFMSETSLIESNYEQIISIFRETVSLMRRRTGSQERDSHQVEVDRLNEVWIEKTSARIAHEMRVLNPAESEDLRAWLEGPAKRQLEEIKARAAFSGSASKNYTKGLEAELREDFPLAAAYYIKASRKNSAARGRLESLYHSDKIKTRPHDAIAIGNLYSFCIAKVGWADWDQQRGRWYSRAAIAYQTGHGVIRDLPAAAKLFRIVCELGCQGQGYLTEIYRSPELTQQDASAIGRMYTYGHSVASDPTKALLWHNKAIEMDSQSLGAATAKKDAGVTLESIGKFAPAAALYRESIDLGDSSATQDHTALLMSDKPDRRTWKTIERELVIWLHRRGGTRELLTYRDPANSTLIMRSADRYLLKHVARLKILQVPHDPDFKFFSTSEARSRVTRLRRQTKSLIEKLRKPFPETIRSRITGESHFSEAVIDELHRRPLITPLLELTKLAALGCHRLSRRTKFTDDHYDSDDDVNETFNDHYQLEIEISRESSISEIYVSGVNGLWGRDAGGVYHGYEWNENTIFLGTSSERWTNGTLLHELTHFLTNELFDNRCLPYGEEDVANQERFIQITRDLKQRFETRVPGQPVLTEELDRVVGNIFSSPLYTSERSYQAELIVKIPELIARGKEGVEAEIRAHLPDLMNYYENTFIPKVESHTKAMREIALGHWPLEIFSPEVAAPAGPSIPLPAEPAASTPPASAPASSSSGSTPASSV